MIEKHFKRSFCAVLAFVMLLVSAVGCSEESETKKKKKIIKKIIVSENNTSEPEQTAETENQGGEYSEDTESTASKIRRELAVKDVEKVEIYIPEYKLKTVGWDGPQNYVIVAAKGNSANQKTAGIIRDYFAKNAGVTLQVVTDDVKETEREILVGDTNRYTTKLDTTHYAVKLKDQKLIFEGGHFAMVEKAADWFATLSYKKGQVNTLTGSCEDFEVEKKGGYKYIWGDEFDGNTLDMTKWCFVDKMAGTSSMPCLQDENVVNVNDGLLKLSAVRYFDQLNPAYQYATNSSVCTQDTMGYKYGYIEIRARVPYKRGAWPSFWFVSKNALGNRDKTHIYNVEVDVFEVFSSTNTAVPNLHKWRIDTSLPNAHTMYNGNHYLNLNAVGYKFLDSENLSDEYHIYGFKWTPNEMVMSVDGEDYMSFDLSDDFDQRDGMDDFNVTMFPIFNNFIYVSDLSQTNGTNQINNSDLPIEYYIDWIRLYQIPGQGEFYTTDNN